MRGWIGLAAVIAALASLVALDLGAEQRQAPSGADACRIRELSGLRA